MSPPRFAARAISTSATIDSSRRGGDQPSRRAADAAACQSATQPMNPANSIQVNPTSADVLVEADRGLGDPRLVPQLLIGGDAGHVGGKRQDRDREEHFQPAQLQRLVTPDKGDDEQAQRDDRADSGHVVQQQMQMREVEGCDRRHVGAYGTR